MALDTNQDLESWQTSRPRQVKVSFLGHFFVTDSTPHVRVFNADGTYERQFVAVSPEKVPSNSNMRTKLTGLALDFKGNLYVGAASNDGSKPYISKHAQDGSHLSSFNVDTEAHYIAVTFQDTIIFTSENNSTANIVDQNGNLLHTLLPTAGVIDWIPRGIFCCRDTIFLSNHGFRNKSSIYCYSLTGEYIGAITEDLPSSIDLVVTEGGNVILATASDKVTVLERKI